MNLSHNYKFFKFSSSSGDSGTVSESDSGKSSPGSFPDHPLQNGSTTTTALTNNKQQSVVQQQNKANLEKSSQLLNENGTVVGTTFGSSVQNIPEINTNCHPFTNGGNNSNNSNVIDTACKLTLFFYYVCEPFFLFFCFFLFSSSLFKITYFR